MLPIAQFHSHDEEKLNLARPHECRSFLLNIFLPSLNTRYANQVSLFPTDYPTQSHRALLPSTMRSLTDLLFSHPLQYVPQLANHRAIDPIIFRKTQSAS